MTPQVLAEGIEVTLINSITPMRSAELLSGMRLGWLPPETSSPSQDRPSPA